MRRILSLLLSLILVLSLLSCKATEDNDETEIVKSDSEGKIPICNVTSTANSTNFEAEYVENIDNKYHVYYFYLGLISKVPAYTSDTLKYQYDTTVEFSFSSLNAESLSNEISKSEEIIKARSNGGSIGIGAELTGEWKDEFSSLKATLSSSINTNWSNNWSKTVTESTSKTSTYIKEYTQGYKETVTFSEGAGFKKGYYYREVFYETVKAYGVLIYDVEEQTYATASQTFLQSNSTVRVWEESESENFNYEKSETLSFNVDGAIAYAKNNPPVAVDPNTNSNYGSVVAMNKYQPKDNSNYNKNDLEDAESWLTRHNGFSVGELYIYGAHQTGSVYKIGDKNALALRYKVVNNPADLPRVGTDLTHVEDDAATAVAGTNINEKIGYGAYWVRITYTDDSQIQYNKTNILKDATEGTIITILDENNINLQKNIKKIELVLVYELYAGGDKGFLWQWWHEYPNYRFEYTFNFS